jgi:P-type E1-E2 ATPase
MMIAIVLSLNMRKLLKSKVLVRKLLGIETAGSLSILFTDKTGTLTKGTGASNNIMANILTIVQASCALTYS